MASNNLISSYKAYTLAPIYQELKALGLEISKGDLELKIKKFTGIQKSCSEMTDPEIREHNEGAKFYSEHLNLGIDFEKDDRIKLNFNRE